MTTIDCVRTRVAVVDDQRLFAYGLEMLISSQPDLEFVGSASNGAAGVELAARVRPDIVMMDLRMPGMDGIEATSRITSLSDDDGAVPRVIVLTMFQRGETVLTAFRSGASAFLTKDEEPEAVLGTIRSVHSGETMSAPTVTVNLIREFASNPAPSVTRAPNDVLQRLTPRESEVLLLVARGLSNAEISRSAFISEATTKTHLRSILAKLGLRSRVQAVVFAYENGLVG